MFKRIIILRSRPSGWKKKVRHVRRGHTPSLHAYTRVIYFLFIFFLLCGTYEAYIYVRVVYGPLTD